MFDCQVEILLMFILLHLAGLQPPLFLQIETNNEKVGNSKKCNYLKILKSLSIFVTLLT